MFLILNNITKAIVNLFILEGAIPLDAEPLDSPLCRLDEEVGCFFLSKNEECLKRAGNWMIGNQPGDTD